MFRSNTSNVLLNRALTPAINSRVLVTGPGCFQTFYKIRSNWGDDFYGRADPIEKLLPKIAKEKSYHSRERLDKVLVSMMCGLSRLVWRQMFPQYFRRYLQHLPRLNQRISFDDFRSSNYLWIMLRFWRGNSVLLTLVRITNISHCLRLDCFRGWNPGTSVTCSQNEKKISSQNAVFQLDLIHERH